ncbi:MAG: ankyrin repeat domain-containing protein [Synechococcus sp.]
MDAAYQGDLSRFKSLIAGCPGLLSQRSSISHPNLFQFVVVEGGLGKIPKVSDFVKFTIECGASLDYPLVAAASVNSREIVDQLLDSGASVESCKPWTALEEALYWAHQEMGIYLWRERGAQVRSLRAASELGELELMKEYFDADGNLFAQAGPVRFPFEGVSYSANDVLNQALILSLKNRQYDAASMLIENGADVNSIPPGNHERCTPLHQAVYMNDLEMVDWLMERGAVATIEDPRFKNTAIGWANHFGYDMLAKYIESK